MPQYQENAATVVARFQNSGLNAETIDSIAALLPGAGQQAQIDTYTGGPAASGTHIVTVGAAGAAGPPLTTDPGAPVIIMDAGSPGANVVLDAAGGNRMIVAGGGNDVIQSEGAGNVSVETGGGNDSVSTGDGEDQVVITGIGDSSVSTGAGDDQIVITGAGSASVSGGDGNDVIILASDSTQATIVGGDGQDQLQLADSRGNHNFTIVNGVVVMHSNEAIQLESVEVVQFQDGISVLAESSTDAAAGRMYEVLFDREADLPGLEFWTGRDDVGASLTDIAKGFVSSQEFQNKFASDSNEVFLGKLYEGMAGHAADTEGLAYWMNQMENNGLSKADVAMYFAESQEAIDLMGIDGTHYVIDISGQA